MKTNSHLTISSVTFLIAIHSLLLPLRSEAILSVSGPQVVGTGIIAGACVASGATFATNPNDFVHEGPSSIWEKVGGIALATVGTIALDQSAPERVIRYAFMTDEAREELRLNVEEQEAYNENLDELGVLRQTTQKLLKKEGLSPESFDGKEKIKEMRRNAFESGDLDPRLERVLEVFDDIAGVS